MADVTGPISSLRGSRHAMPADTMCDEHPDRPAIARVQGETDSFGSEMHDLCQECLTELRAYEASPEARTGRCDWCEAQATDLRDSRDYEEGLAGRVYRVCGACISRQNNRLREEEERYAYEDDGRDDYDADPPEPEPEPLPRRYEHRSKQWRWKEHWSGETGTYRMGSVSAWVRDYDGDFAGYHVKRGDEIILEGECPDWDQAIRAVEEKLVEIGWLAPPPYGVEDAT